MRRLRYYELSFVLTATGAYIVRRLFELSWRFDANIRTAQLNGVSNARLLDNLAEFEYIPNVMFPTVAGGLLFVAAWYVFHYWAFPRLRQNTADNQAIVLSLLSAVLVGLSVWVYSYFKLEWRFRYDSSEQIVGLKVYSLFRKLHWLSNTFAALLVILIYEAIAQVYYHTTALYEQYGQAKHRLLGRLLVGSAVALTVCWVMVGQIANLVLGGWGVIASLLILCLTVVLHEVFFQKIIPFFSKFRLDTLDGLLYVFAGFSAYGLLSLVFFAGWMASYGRRAEDFAVYYLLPSGVAFVTALVRWVFFVDTQGLQTKVLRQSAELSHLRSQINPHFLFNALNTLYAVAMKEHSERTADGIQKLGDMMRFMLHENNQERIPLSKEIEYLVNFLDIQRMRLDESQGIEIRVNLAPAAQEVYIAPMLLNPFVENAFKHGISFRSASWIYITLTQDATKLYFKVHNSVHPKLSEDPEHEQSGIGLENVRKRLELLYPNRHTLDIQATEHDFFVSLVLHIY